MLRFVACLLVVCWSIPLAMAQQPEKENEKVNSSITSEQLDKWAKDKGLSSIVLGAGCFWCTEAALTQINGVEKVVSGYTGGHVDNPTYEMVIRKTTGHVEVAQVFFDKKIVRLEQIMAVFFAIHDPTSMDRQGGDVGPQYRSAIFYADAEQKKIAEECLAIAGKALAPSKIVTVLEPLKKFYPAEDYHQEYYKYNPQNPYCQAIVREKVMKVRKAFEEMLKAEVKAEIKASK
jgi:peptide-methionine (S)-S-oxide reductase